jgi:hypothetical protein
LPSPQLCKSCSVNSFKRARREEPIELRSLLIRWTWAYLHHESDSLSDRETVGDLPREIQHPLYRRSNIAKGQL